MYYRGIGGTPKSGCSRRNVEDLSLTPAAANTIVTFGFSLAKDETAKRADTIIKSIGAVILFFCFSHPALGGCPRIENMRILPQYIVSIKKIIYYILYQKNRNLHSRTAS
jgi:hypothetical protein